MTHKVVHFVDSTAFGGTEQIVLACLKSLDRLKWSPVLWYYPEPALDALLSRASRLGVETRAIPNIHAVSVLAHVPRLTLLLRRERPKVFHAHLNRPLGCKHALVAAALAGVPAVVATVQLLPVDPPRRMTRLQVRLVACGVHRLLAVSRHVATRLRDVYRIPAERLRVVPNGIPIGQFDSPAGTRLRGLVAGNESRALVLTTSRLDDQKGLRYLLGAALAVPEATFVVAGDGPKRAALEAEVLGLGLAARVLFLGHRTDIPDLLASCDVFVLPSLFEGLPLAILEAMAAGKPVVASAIGGTDEAVVNGQTGLLVPAGDSESLANAVRSILHNPVLAARLGAAGRVRARRCFSDQLMVRRVERTYQELLATSGHVAR